MKQTVTATLLLLLQAGLCIADGLPIGSKSPDITGETIDGKLFELNNEIGKPKVVNFFSIYCGPCIKELPELAGIQRYHPKVDFIAVHTIDIKKEKVAAFIERLPGAPSRVVLANEKVKKSFRYFGLPHTVVLDKNNIVRMTLSGYAEGNVRMLERFLNRNLR